MLLKLLVIVFSISVVTAELNPTETYVHSATLRSGNIKLYWKFNDTDITIEVHGRTQGWIGIGFSPNGAMTGADIIVGWVKDGVTYVTDRHGTGNEFPPRDTEQNLHVIAGKECDGWTMFRFTRQLAACEPDQDVEISKSTQRLIYAYGTQDPSGDDLSERDYHGTRNRGAESMYFLETSSDASDDVEDNTEHFEILNDKFHVPAEETYYSCRLHKMVTLPGKRHVIKFEHVIQQGNELNVHHILVYSCGNVLQNPDELNKNARCNSPNMAHFRTCVTILFAWAIGGGHFLMPKEAGFSIGGDGDPAYILMEIHYDNPGKRNDIIDSSGIRFIYTSNLRKYDAGVLQTGNMINPSLHVIPPKAKSFLNVGFCPQSCYEKRMNSSHVDKLNIFAVVLHSHLAGRKLKLRHFRNGEELPNIAYDDAYDFNYQEFRKLDPMVELIGATDYTRTECVYNTEHRTEMVEGGTSTYQEMCMAFLFYYPRIDFGTCTTAPVKYQTYPYFGIYNVTKINTKTLRFYDSIQNYNVTAASSPAFIGKTVGTVMSSYNWTEDTIDKFSSDLLKMTQILVCSTSSKSTIFTVQKVEYPVIESPYVREAKQCLARNSTLKQTKDTDSCSTASAFTSNLFLVFAILVLTKNFSA